jgi:hypothetical protein
MRTGGNLNKIHITAGFEERYNKDFIIGGESVDRYFIRIACRPFDERPGRF